MTLKASKPISMPRTSSLDPSYTSEIDTVDERAWCQILQEFDDANIYQTWSYTALTSGERMSHLILRKNSDIVAVALVRIARAPLINVGVAYVRWGPLWRRGGAEASVETFRQAVRALRNEFSCRRGLVLRLFPIIYEDDHSCFSAILTEEGFSLNVAKTRARTILMDITPPLEVLRQGMKPHWKRELKLAERNALEVVEGTDDAMFGVFIDIYREMVSRKRFVEGNDVNQFRLMQSQLPQALKMKIMLCRSEAGVCAGLVYSAIGNTGIYLFGATSNIGMKSNGSYLLHWKAIELLRKDGCAVYNLNGINPARNPGTYKFKHDFAGMHGKDVHFLGRFDSSVGVLSRWCVEFVDTTQVIYRTLKERGASIRFFKLRSKASS